jgi:hypothetical protein
MKENHQKFIVPFQFSQGIMRTKAEIIFPEISNDQLHCAAQMSL